MVLLTLMVGGFVTLWAWVARPERARFTGIRWSCGVAEEGNSFGERGRVGSCFGEVVAVKFVLHFFEPAAIGSSDEDVGMQLFGCSGLVVAVG